MRIFVSDDNIKYYEGPGVKKNKIKTKKPEISYMSGQEELYLWLNRSG